MGKLKALTTNLAHVFVSFCPLQRLFWQGRLRCNFTLFGTVYEMIYDVERIMDPGQHPPTPHLADYFSCAYVLK